MATILDTTSIYFDDVNLIAQPAAIQSRSEVPSFTDRIFVSPMEAVVGESFIKEASLLGLSVCTPKFGAIDKSLRIFSASRNKDNTYVGIGLNDWDRASELANVGAKNWLIDCANGYLSQIKEVIQVLCGRHEVQKLMIGNVTTLEGILLYKNIMLEHLLNRFYIRLGLSNGFACDTKNVTGYNRGNITEIVECAKGKKEVGCRIVSDGGIRNAGCAAKAFGAGSDAVLMGGYFAQADCAETWIRGDGTYWGGASTKQQQLNGSVTRHSEGKVIPLENKRPLKDLVNDLVGGIASAVSYSGYKSLPEFIGNGVFERKHR